MTVNTTTASQSYLGNGVTVAFPISFYFLQDTHILAQRIDPDGSVRTLVLNSEFTLTGAGNEAGGTLTASVPVPSGSILYITRNIPAVQLTEYPENDKFPAASHEKALDYLTMLAQSVRLDVTDALRLASNRTEFDARGLRIGNVADATSGDDAATLSQVSQMVAAAGTGTLPSQIVTFSALASAIGATYTAYTPTSGVKKTLDDLWNQGLTVENFGAAGDGTSDDSAAFTAMLTSVGYVRLRKKTYYINNWTPSAQTTVVMIGAGKPSPNSSYTGLIDGTGSIVVGRIFFRASQYFIKDFGVDVGDTRALITTSRDGLIADAPVSGVGYHSFIGNVSSCGKSTSDASHGILQEGFEGFRIENCDVFQHNFGVVVKSRNGFISNIRGYGVKVATVYPKGSASASAGNVADGSVNNVIIDGVISRCFTSSTTQPGLGVWVHSEGTPVSNVVIRGVIATGGRCAVRFSADVAGGYYVSSSSAAAIRSANQLIGWEAFGPTFETTVDAAHIDNPSAGEMFQTDASASNWRATNHTHVITDAGIAGTSAATMLGTGSWDGITARTVNTMLISHSLTSVRGGRKSGTVKYSGEGNLALGSGMVAAAGEIVPQVMMKPDNTVVLTGVINPSAGGSTTLGTLSGAMNFGTNRYFAVPARNTSNAYTTADVLASGTSLTLLAPAPSTLNQVSLDAVIIHRT